MCAIDHISFLAKRLPTDLYRSPALNLISSNNNNRSNWTERCIGFPWSNMMDRRLHPIARQQAPLLLVCREAKLTNVCSIYGIL